MTRKGMTVLTVWAGLVGGCTVPVKGGFSDVQNLVGERMEYRLHWYQGTPGDAEVAERVQAMLAEELSVSSAVKIALLNNRDLQAIYEELGVAQADLVQAGLLRNPIFFGHVRFPEGGGSGTNTELGLAFDFLDLLLLPARKNLAGLEFEAAKRRVSAAVIDLVAEVQRAYYMLQGDLQTTAMLRTIADAAGSAYEFARRQREVGNVNELELNTEQGLYEETKLELALADLQVLADRERLTRLMGVWGLDTGWRIGEQLPEVPEQEVRLAALESLAIENRLDLAAQRKETEVLAQALETVTNWRWIGSAEVGASTEREPGGGRVTGPFLALGLPIFDQGQAQIARLEALVRRSRQDAAALAIEIRSEVRDVRNRLLMSRNVAEHYRLVVIPLREEIVALTQRHYNFMLVGVFQLLEAKRDEIGAYRNYIETVRDYWIARTDLERAVGGSLSEATNN